MKYVLILIAVFFSLSANAQNVVDTNSINYLGGISGRNIVAYPSPQAQFKEGGMVKVKVWVNRDGDIIRHEVQYSENATLRSIAEQKIRNVKFNRKPDAAVEQSGILTFNFNEKKNVNDAIDYKQKYFQLLEDYKKLSDENRRLLENTK